MNRYPRRRVWKRLRAATEAKTKPVAFEPPKYVASLIGSINDGARAAQTGALFFAFIGLYLLAVAFSTADEDLLRERTIAVAQLGMAVPVVFSFAVAPIIFVFLHLHTLIRYDMLSANLWQFDRDLGALSREDDQERCRHLLANVEFLREQGARLGTPLNSPLYRAMGWFMLAGFPLLVLTIIQLSALRYQDEGIVWTQRVALVVDLAALLWFFSRKWRLWEDAGAQDDRRTRRRRGLAYVGTLLLLAVNLAWMGVPGPDATTVGHRAIEARREAIRKAFGPREARRASQYLAAAGEFVLGMWRQPVDLGMCLHHLLARGGALRFGCRYLSVPYTLLLAAPADAAVLARLRTQDAAPADADIASIEGLNLRDRTLRFIDLRESRLYAAALTGAEMQGALLEGARLGGAHLEGADLRGAVGLTQEQLEWVSGDYRTILPEGLTRPTRWLVGGLLSCLKPVRPHLSPSADPPPHPQQALFPENIQRHLQRVKAQHPFSGITPFEPERVGVVHDCRAEKADHHPLP